jgi:hypothetical protein
MRQKLPGTNITVFLLFFGLSMLEVLGHATDRGRAVAGSRNTIPSRGSRSSVETFLIAVPRDVATASRNGYPLPRGARIVYAARAPRK